MKDLLRVAAATPKVHIGNVMANVTEISAVYEAHADMVDMIVTPELSLTGYTCADLFENRQLIEQAKKGLLALAELTGKWGEQGAALLAGLPFELDGRLYNCAAFIHAGRVAALVPKLYLPNYGEFYEKRWFSSGSGYQEISLDETHTCGFGTEQIVVLGSGSEAVKIGIEICEDAWTPISPGRLAALQGAEVICNLSASNEVIGKAQYRRTLASAMSSGCLCGYVYVSAGMYESTSDLVFSGHNLIYENGRMLGEREPFADGILIRDLNLTKIRHDRIANKSFADCKERMMGAPYKKVWCHKDFVEKQELMAKLSMTPFVPSKNLLERCLSIFRMQVAGLQRRMEATGCKCIVVGVSGGLDSTLALLVSAQAVRNLGLPAKTLVGITMPGFGTTGRTKNNSITLMEYLGCDIREIPIVDSVRQHFADIGHDEAVHDITYENCQARERTQILMDVANKEGGFVIGTGDLSELALGWCTYNGDHMSMYAVNTSIPKTLVRTLVDQVGHYMSANGFAGIEAVVEDIMDTPVSPELLPPNPDGTIAQKTEDTVGSYILHDFFLYYTLRYGMTPEQIFWLCQNAVKQDPAYTFSDTQIRHWMNVFYTRFFRQQFKRNCMPDGVKVGTVSVSPRGDLRLPSEIEFAEFLREED